MNIWHIVAFTAGAGTAGLVYLSVNLIRMKNAQKKITKELAELVENIVKEL